MEAKLEASHMRLVHSEPSGPAEGFGGYLKGGLPVYRHPTIEGAESTWTDLDSRDDKINLQRGALAHSVSENRIYGESSLRQFAARVHAEYSTVLDWMGTYRRLMALPDDRRERVLSLDRRYSHYRALNGVRSDERYEALLQQANRKKWSVGKMLDALYELRRQDSETYVVQHEGEPKVFEVGTGHYPSAEEFAKEKAEALASAELYAKEGADTLVSSPQPTKVDAEELAGVGKEYERDVIERFCDWLADRGIVLADDGGVVLKYYVEVERYAGERL